MRKPALVAGCLAALAPAAAAAEPAAEGAGRGFYRSGRAEPPVLARLLPSGRAVEAQSFACARCHGFDGEGGVEGTARPPPLTWSVLGAPRAAGGGAAARPAYDEALLVRAITAGMDAGGRPLNPAMPRFALAPEQAAALIAHLRVIGTEAATEPGVAEGSVRIGTAQPLTGPLAPVGAAVAATLRAFFDVVNGEGGLYGRRLELVLRDAGPGGSGDAATAARVLLAEDGVFAVLAPFDGSRMAGIAGEMQRQGVPLLGPLAVPDAADAEAASTTFFLLPSFRDQARALVDLAVSEAGRGTAGLRAVVLHGPDAAAREAAGGAEAEAQRLGLVLAARRATASPPEDPAALASWLAEARPDAVLVLAPAAAVAAVADALGRGAAGPVPPVYGLTLLLGPGGAGLREAAGPIRLGHPFLPGVAEGAFRRFAAARGLALTHPALQGLAFAAAASLAEGLKGAGRRLTRPGMVQAVERLPELHTGVLPPLRFGPGRHTGPGGIALVGVDGRGGSGGPRETSGAPAGEP